MEEKVETLEADALQADREMLETQTEINQPEEKVRTIEAVSQPDTPETTAMDSQERPIASVAPQHCSCGGGETCTCGSNGAASYVYTIGELTAKLPSDSIEAEFEAARNAIDARGPDNALMYEVLSQGQNLYLARAVCWILQVDSVDTYIVKPRSYVEMYELVSAIEPLNPGDKHYSVVVGPRGPLAPPEMCNGLQLPIVVCNQLYDFTFDEFVQAIVVATGVTEPVAADMFQQMLSLNDNAGETDEHRAINYVTLRYMQIYKMAAEMLDPEKAPVGVYFLTGVSAKTANVEGIRSIIDVIFRYQERDTREIVNWFCSVDVTGQFPFLVRGLSRYYPHP